MCTKLFVDFLSKAYAKYTEHLRFRVTENPQEWRISADDCGIQNADKD